MTAGTHLKKAGALIAVIASALLQGCSDSNPRQDSAEIAAKVQQGAALFEENCAQCHPRSGRGDYLKRIPATLLTRRSEHELVTWIQGSDKHREMPNFTDLSDSERSALALYLFDQISPR
ncbi:MAG: cytochrome c [Porticoccaceae bacterium]|nr:cytochrome c [Porticoccaceae bacterium]